ncbi:Centrosomal protein of 76 kDa [Terramyces sp. JEL0728]|nr:Centrosomal protein of 76 kDa [Terramyces sp. JEL0728]
MQVDLKNVVDSKLSTEGKVTLGQDYNLKDEEAVRSMLNASGLIDKLIKQENGIHEPPKQIENIIKSAPLERDRLRKHLQITLKNGRAIVGLDNINQDPTKTLQVNFSYEGNRYSSKLVMSDIEPNFNESFKFHIPQIDLSLMIEEKSLIHIVLVQKDISDFIKVVGVANIPLQAIFHCGRQSSLVQLNDISNPEMITGVLDITVELHPKTNFLPKEHIDYHFARLDKLNAEIFNSYFVYAKQWWNDYLQIRSSHATRLVKLFATNEQGKRIPVTHFLQPLQSKWIQTPSHAARDLEIWPNLHTCFVSKKGDLQEHCLLLCSLLLGFYLDAYLTMGTDKNNTSHLWVTTIDIHGNVTFWESLTGMRYGQKDVHHFRSVGCCFNNKSYFANIQIKDASDQISFNFKNSSQWKLLNQSNQNTCQKISILPAKLDKEVLEEEIHSEICQAIEYFRQDHHLTCLFDEKLELLLGECVWNLENSKLSNLNTTIFGDDFQTGIKQYIPEGHTFKGFPHCFNHLHGQRIISGLMKTKQCRDIMLTRGDMVRLAVKVSIYKYCEGTVACWVMVGSRSLIYA